MRVIGADDLCAAMLAQMQAQLPSLIERLDLDLEAPKRWDQAPTLAALQNTAVFPAGAVISPGLTSSPVRRSPDRVDATWRIVVAVYTRGVDYTATARSANRWAALVRAAALADRTLGGIAESVVWVGEDYAERPDPAQARTLAGCTVSFDVTAENVADLSHPQPRVASTTTRVTTR